MFLELQIQRSTLESLIQREVTDILRTAYPCAPAFTPPTTVLSDSQRTRAAAVGGATVAVDRIVVDSVSIGAGSDMVLYDPIGLSAFHAAPSPRLLIRVNVKVHLVLVGELATRNNERAPDFEVLDVSVAADSVVTPAGAALRIGLSRPQVRVTGFGLGTLPFCALLGAAGVPDTQCAAMLAPLESAVASASILLDASPLIRLLNTGGSSHAFWAGAAHISTANTVVIRGLVAPTVAWLREFSESWAISESERIAARWRLYLNTLSTRFGPDHVRRAYQLVFGPAFENALQPDGDFGVVISQEFVYQVLLAQMAAGLTSLGMGGIQQPIRFERTAVDAGSVRFRLEGNSRLSSFLACPILGGLNYHVMANATIGITPSGEGYADVWAGRRVWAGELLFFCLPTAAWIAAAGGDAHYDLGELAIRRGPATLRGERFRALASGTALVGRVVLDAARSPELQLASTNRWELLPATECPTPDVVGVMQATLTNRGEAPLSLCSVAVTGAPRVAVLVRRPRATTPIAMFPVVVPPGESLTLLVILERQRFPPPISTPVECVLGLPCEPPPSWPDRSLRLRVTTSEGVRDLALPRVPWATNAPFDEARGRLRDLCEIDPNAVRAAIRGAERSRRAEIDTVNFEAALAAIGSMPGSVDAWQRAHSPFESVTVVESAGQLADSMSRRDIELAMYLETVLRGR